MERAANCLKKLKRMSNTLHHKEADRVPITDFFWGSFIARWKKELGLANDADPYYYYDLDLIVTTANMDPHIKSFETLKEDNDEVIIKTGFETVIRKKFDFPMPEQISWDTNSIEKLESFEFDDPHDRRRYFEAGDNQIAGVTAPMLNYAFIYGNKLRAAAESLGASKTLAPNSIWTITLFGGFFVNLLYCLFLLKKK